jgi:hypothetical protein
VRCGISDAAKVSVDVSGTLFAIDMRPSIELEKKWKIDFSSRNKEKEPVNSRREEEYKDYGKVSVARGNSSGREKPTFPGFHTTSRYKRRFHS